jgi:hypothetical protein
MLGWPSRRRRPPAVRRGDRHRPPERLDDLLAGDRLDRGHRVEVGALGLVLDPLDRPARDAPRQVSPQAIPIGRRQRTRRVLREQRRDLRARDVRVDDAVARRLRRTLGRRSPRAPEQQRLGVDRERVRSPHGARPKRRKCSTCGLDRPLRATDQGAISDDRRAPSITEPGERVSVAVEDAARAHPWPVV